MENQFSRYKIYEKFIHRRYNANKFVIRSIDWKKLSPLFSLLEREVTFLLGGGRLGPQRGGSSVKVWAFQGEGHISFPQFVN